MNEVERAAYYSGMRQIFMEGLLEDALAAPAKPEPAKPPFLCDIGSTSPYAKNFVSDLLNEK